MLPSVLFAKRSRGLATLPGRVGSTLKRKFWDSNELVSSTAGQEEANEPWQAE